MSNYSINIKATIKDAFIALDEFNHGDQTLFVLDDEDRMVGTLTDGDIRRGLICGKQLNDSVESVMHKDFKYIMQSEFDMMILKKYRDGDIFFIPMLDEDMHIVEIYNFLKYKSFLPIDAVMMAGGKGERLRPLTDKTPKPLLPLGDKAIIDHNIDRLISYGVKNISVTVNYLKEQIEEHFAEPHNGVQVLTYQEPKFLGTIGSIKFVQNFKHDVVLLMNSDVFTNIDFEDFFLHFQQHEAEMSVAAIPYIVKVPYGVFDLNGRNIQGLIEKPTYNYYANAGIYLIKRRALEEIPENTFFNATDLIDKLIVKGKKVIRYPLNGTWIDIGNPQEYAKANELVKHLI
ncbi:MAG: nucleotidyltransferase family protein [Bacteroidales bacterium]|jgi:dTDP-glucose pyrophosphorylase|nr:nucleotidyltransferase family protein [Bacteroidales bacterium]